MRTVHFPDQQRVELVERPWPAPAAGELLLALAEGRPPEAALARSMAAAALACSGSVVTPAAVVTMAGAS